MNRRSLGVSVMSTFQDVPHILLSQSILARQANSSAVRGRCSTSSYFSSRRGTYLCRRVTSPLGGFIDSVRFWIAKKQMVRTDARRVVAVMKCLHPFGYRPTVCQLPGVTVGKHCLPPNIKLAVSMRVATGDPEPASLGFLNFGPEVGFNRNGVEPSSFRQIPTGMAAGTPPTSFNVRRRGRKPPVTSCALHRNIHHDHSEANRPIHATDYATNGSVKTHE